MSKWWFESTREQELRLEVLEKYAETGNSSLLHELQEIKLLEEYNMELGILV